MSSRPSSSSPGARQALAKRKATATEWLESHVLWHEGHAVWKSARGRMRPGAADLSSAQRCLHKCRVALRGDHPEPLVPGEGEAWLEARFELLHLAKRLCSLDAPDLASLASSSRARNPAAIGRLVELLIAEAVCLNELPLRPSTALQSTAVDAVAADLLQKLARDGSAPPSARALAAMTLGARQKAQSAQQSGRGESHFAPNAIAAESADSACGAWIRRAYEWGLRRGLPDEPALTVAFLGHDQGVRAARECSLLLGRFSLVRFSPQLVREMLADGMEPLQVLEVVQAALAIEPVASCAMQFFRSLLEQPLLDVEHHQNQSRAQSASQKKQLNRRSKERRAQERIEQARLDQQELVQSRAEMLAQISKLLARVVRATRDAQAVRNWVGTLEFFVRPLFGCAPDLWLYISRAGSAGVGKEMAALLEEALRPSKSAATLGRELQKSFGEILMLCQGGRWDTSEIAELASKAPRLGVTGQWRQWQEKTWHRDIKPLRALLVNCGDGEIVREALEMEVHGDLSLHVWREAEMYRLLLWLARLFLRDLQSWRLWDLCQTLGFFPSAAAARAALAPVVEALRAASPKVRERLFFVLLDTAGKSRQAMRNVWPRFSPHVPLLRRFAQSTANLSHLTYCVYVAVRIEAFLWQRSTSTSDEAEAAPMGRNDDDHRQEVQAWLKWLVDFLREAEADKKNPLKYFDPDAIARLSLSLADGDFCAFQPVFASVSRTRFNGNSAHLEAGLHALAPYRALRGALAHLFARQPSRCASLLVRLGLAARLGPEVLSPLSLLQHDAHYADAVDSVEAEGSDWRELLALAPDLAESAACYRWARRHLEQSLEVPIEVPSGVRQALREPSKRANELKHIERKLLEHPERADLAARAASLRAQLGEGARLQRGVGEQARQRLALAQAEAVVALGEQQVLGCYKARLAQVAGAIPPGLIWSDDWFNATLLTVDIESNRRLLRRLLRAEIAGQKRWREEHPANANFLRGLAERGVDVKAWLSARPRRYNCESVGGSVGVVVRLRLERDPLHILQMGNYFDTCLSFGNCNSFSTVANASELNKRVLYARDGAGRVVARKLIGINAAGEMVGFYTYTSLANDAANQALRAIFHHYTGEFAHACGLSLGDEGQVEVLLAENWYDDGIVPWHGAQNIGSGRARKEKRSASGHVTNEKQSPNFTCD